MDHLKLTVCIKQEIKHSSHTAQTAWIEFCFYEDLEQMQNAYIYLFAFGEFYEKIFQILVSF